MEYWLGYLALGVAVGFLAGLLGIGGGMLTVPVFVFIFAAQAFPAEHLMHFALGTGMATIVFTSAASLAAHHRRAAVDWAVARAMAPGIVAGSFGSAFVAAYVPTRALAAVFAVFLLIASAQMLFPPRLAGARRLPGRAGLCAAGAAIGAVSAILAAGGAFLSVPFLTGCKVPLHRAIGTAAANGFPIAVAGALGYVLQGLRAETPLPAGSLGFVYLPAFFLVVTASVPMAPLGARLAHRMPVRPLRAVFAILLALLALRMLASLW